MSGIVLPGCLLSKRLHRSKAEFATVSASSDVWLQELNFQLRLALQIQGNDYSILSIAEKQLHNYNDGSFSLKFTCFWQKGTFKDKITEFSS